jgi:hypothetical protein
MSFRPNIHDELTIDGVTYRIAEHPAAPGFPYGQEGRAGIVYCLQNPATASKAALKVFKPRFRTPALVSQAEKLAAFADLPGLTVCRRTVLTRAQNADLLRQHPDLIYAVLMPWIEGPTWTEVMLEKRPLTPQRALDLARALAEVLESMEVHGLAHCDLSGPNVLLPMLAGQTADRRPQTAYRPPSAVELVDVEGLYAPGLPRPEALPSGSSGYAHRTAREGLWGPTADRFAGAVLLAEMLGWCDPQVVQAAWGESYFDPQEMQQDTPRYRTLMAALERRWGSNVARLFERAWRSDSLLDCPTFGEWLVALPEHPAVGLGQALPLPVAPPGPREEERSTAPAAVEATAEIRAFMQAARRMEDKGDLDSASETLPPGPGAGPGQPLPALPGAGDRTDGSGCAGARPPYFPSHRRGPGREGYFSPWGGGKGRSSCGGGAGDKGRTLPQTPLGMGDGRAGCFCPACRPCIWCERATAAGCSSGGCRCTSSPNFAFTSSLLDRRVPNSDSCSIWSEC